MSGNGHPPFRADHVGSLLRPQEVLGAHAALAEGRISEQDLTEIEDQAIIGALEMQREVGLEIFSDGEYRRRGWAGGFPDSVEGYVEGDRAVAFNWQGGQRAQAGGRVIGAKLVPKRRIAGHEAAFLKAHAPGAWKITMPAASYVVMRGWVPGITDAVYPNRKALFADVVAIIRDEINRLIADGATYIQIDNPHYADYISAERVQSWRDMGLDPEKVMEEDIAGDNACWEGVDRSKVIVATHICRGNSRSSWHTSGGYDPIAERVFGGLDIDRFLLEYDTDRSGGFEPLRFMPKGRTVVLGLITTKAGELEDRNEVKRRIDEAAKYVDFDDLCLSPQCGFASTSPGNLLTAEEQRRKLELVVETAREVWG